MQGAGYGPQTQQPGIEAILQALAVGGQPLGNIAQLPAATSPQGVDASLQGQPDLQSLQGIGAGQPTSLDGITEEQIMMIMQALQQQGAFNGNSSL